MYVHWISIVEVLELRVHIYYVLPPGRKKDQSSWNVRMSMYACGMDNMIPALRSELCRCGAGLAAVRCNKQSGVGRGGFRLWGSLLPMVK